MAGGEVGPRCVFCELLRTGALLAQNACAAAFPDGFPLAPGHTLVVPKRCVSSFFHLSESEQLDVLRLVNEVRAILDREVTPDGYNVGINIGDAAGQTVSHAHVHVIPRRRGDVADPRGGVRHVIPARARYWDGGGGA